MQINQTLKFTVLAIGIMTAATRGGWAGAAFARSARCRAQAESRRRPEAPSAVPVGRDDGDKLKGRREVTKATAGLLRSRWKAHESSRRRAQATSRGERRRPGTPWRRAGKGKHHREQERRDGGVHGEAGKLIHQYVPPDPAQIQKAKDAKKSPVAAQPDGKVRLEFKDYVLPKDMMSIDVDVKAALLSGFEWRLISRSPRIS